MSRLVFLGLSLLSLLLFATCSGATADGAGESLDLSVVAPLSSGTVVPLDQARLFVPAGWITSGRSERDPPAVLARFTSPAGVYGVASRIAANASVDPGFLGNYYQNYCVTGGFVLGANATKAGGAEAYVIFSRTIKDEVISCVVAEPHGIENSFLVIEFWGAKDALFGRKGELAPILASLVFGSANALLPVVPAGGEVAGGEPGFIARLVNRPVSRITLDGATADWERVKVFQADDKTDAIAAFNGKTVAQAEIETLSVVSNDEGVFFLVTFRGTIEPVFTGNRETDGMFYELLFDGGTGHTECEIYFDKAAGAWGLDLPKGTNKGFQKDLIAVKGNVMEIKVPKEMLPAVAIRFGIYCTEVKTGENRTLDSTVWSGIS